MGRHTDGFGLLQIETGALFIVGLALSFVILDSAPLQAGRETVAFNCQFMTHGFGK